MVPWPETRVSLIARLKSAETQRDWDEFVAIYRPAIYRFARGQGLQDADAQDATQNVLASVARAVEGWEPDPERGPFRAWLARITRNAVVNTVTRGGRGRGSGRTSVVEALAEIPAVDEDDPWQNELRIQRFRAAAEVVRPKCTPDVWSAFWATVVEGRAIEDVAEELGISVGVVYAARSRVMKRLREAVERIERVEGEDES